MSEAEAIARAIELSGTAVNDEEYGCPSCGECGLEL